MLKVLTVAMTSQEREAWRRYLAAETELDAARWALMGTINASPGAPALLDAQVEPAFAGESTALSRV